MAPVIQAQYKHSKVKQYFTATASLSRSLGPSNVHAKVRLLSHRSLGFHSAAPVIALIYLCCAGITVNPPLR